MKFIASARRRAGACLGSRLSPLKATALNVAPLNHAPHGTDPQEAIVPALNETKLSSRTSPRCAPTT
jgi:hypothetical protein